MTQKSKTGKSLTVSDSTYAKLQELQTKLNEEFLSRLGLPSTYKVEAVSLSAVIDLAIEKFYSTRTETKLGGTPTIGPGAVEAGDTVVGSTFKFDTTTPRAQMSFTNAEISDKKESIPFKSYQNDIKKSGHEYPTFLLSCVCTKKNEDIRTDKCDVCTHPKVRHVEEKCLARNRHPVPELTRVSVPSEKEQGRCECSKTFNDLYELSRGTGDRTAFVCPECGHKLREHQQGTPWYCSVRREE